MNFSPVQVLHICGLPREGNGRSKGLSHQDRHHSGASVGLKSGRCLCRRKKSIKTLWRLPSVARGVSMVQAKPGMWLYAWGLPLPVDVQMHWLQDTLHLKGSSRVSHRLPVLLSPTSSQTAFHRLPLSPRRSPFCNASQLWPLLSSARLFYLLKSGSLGALAFWGIQKADWTHLDKLWPTFHSNVLFLKVIKKE